AISRAERAYIVPTGEGADRRRPGGRRRRQGICTAYAIIPREILCGSREGPSVSITARPGVSVRTSWERLDSFLSVLGNQDAEILRADIASLLNDARPADGRMARSHQTRRAIVDAMRALHSEGDLRPTAPRVAARAGVSLRTVWQHFADMETLLLEAGRRDLEILLQIVSPIPS